MQKPTITTRNNHVFEMEDGKLYALSHDNIVTTIGKHELSLDNRLLNDKIQELYAEITELKAENKKLDEKNASFYNRAVQSDCEIKRLENVVTNQSERIKFLNEKNKALHHLWNRNAVNCAPPTESKPVDIFESKCTSVLEGLFAQLDLAVQSKNLTHAQNVALLMEQLLNIEAKLKNEKL